jgi:hypothetical protein
MTGDSGLGREPVHAGTDGVMHPSARPTEKTMDTGGVVGRTLGGERRTAAMPMDRARTPLMRLEALNLFMQTNGAEQLPRDAAAAAAFGTTVAAGLAESMADARLLHGRWAQDLFRAVLISLDEIALIKDEDAGELHYDADEPVHLPDFRVVTKAGEQLLVEVKNVGPKGIGKSQRIPAETVDQLKAYARLTGGRLVFAHFWSAAVKWTVVDADRLTRRGAHCELTFEQAMCANVLGLLGDAVLMTSSVITMELLEDGPEDAEVDPDIASMPLPFVAHSVSFICDGKPVTDPEEYELVKAVTLYGGAALSGIEALADVDGRPVGLVATGQSPAGPESPNIGSFLSSIFTNRYIAVTTDMIDGSVRQMRYEPDPALTRLARTAGTRGLDRKMPVTVLSQRPIGPPAGSGPR